MEISFGDYSIDTGTRLVRRRGEPVHLSPKAFELLEILVAARPRVVSRDELQKELWPSSVVGKANLPKLVCEIRAALGDSPGQAHLIRTVHGFGYAFAGETPPTVPSTDGVPFCWLVHSEGRIALREGEHLVGRHPSSVVPIDSPTVSRNHARLQVLGGGKAILTDLGSRNGTYVSGARVQGSVTLRDGDSILLGSLVLTFRVPALWDPTDDLASPE